MNNRYLKARTLARAKHKDQMYGDLPYFVHLEAVAELARPFGTDAMIIAQLHDVIEDTETTVNELVADFGFLVADAVAYITDNKQHDRLTRKLNANQKLAELEVNEEAARLALIVKACDRLANVRASAHQADKFYLQYQQEHQAFKRAVYREGLCEAVWWELDNLLRQSEVS